MSGAAVTPRRLHKIDVGQKSEPSASGTNAKLRRTHDEYGQVVLGNTTVQTAPTPDEIMDLRHNLFSAMPSHGVHVPAVHALNPQHYRDPSTIIITPPISHLPDQCDFLDPSIAPSLEVDVEWKPLPISLTPTQNIVDSNCSVEDKQELVLNALQYNDGERAEVERLTRGQSTNIEWFYQRMGSITASNGAVTP